MLFFFGQFVNEIIIFFGGDFDGFLLFYHSGLLPECVGGVSLELDVADGAAGLGIFCFEPVGADVFFEIEDTLVDTVSDF